MKKFLIEFFRPIDTLIFNYLVRFGLIKPFFGFLATALGASRLARSVHKKKAEAAKAAQIAASIGTKKGGEKVGDALNAVSSKGTMGGAAMSAGAKTKAKIFPSSGPLLRSSTIQSGLKGAAGTLRSPEGGGAGSAISPGGYGVNFARREKKRKLRATLGYGSRIF